MHATKESPLARAVAKRGRRWLDENLDRQTDSPESHPQTSTQIRAAAIDAIEQHLCDHYTRRLGIEPLCHAIAARLADHGIAVDPEEGVVITAGAEEARFVALRTLGAGQNVYVPQPFAPRYQTALEFADASAIPITLDATLPEADGGILILPTFDPATGQPPTEDILARVADWVRASNLTVIADETDRSLLAGSAGSQPFAVRNGMAERTLTLGGFVHAPALEAWRVGWFAGPNPLVAKVRGLKQAMTICAPAPGQYAALATLQKGD